MILLYVLLVISILVLFMNSGAEIAFFSLGHRDLKLIRTRNYPSSGRIAQLLKEPQLLLSSIQTSNISLRILIVLLCNQLLRQELLPGMSGLIGFVTNILIAFFILALFGEFLPKVWASNNPVRFAYYSSFFVWLSFLVFSSVGNWMTKVTETIEKALGANNDLHARLEQIDQVVGTGKSIGATEEEKNILKGIAQFGNINVKRAMRSRIDVQGIPIESRFDEVKKKVEEQQYSRFPVFEGNLDTVRGMLHSKDLLPHLDKDESFDWRQLIRPAFFIHEHMLIEDLFREFQNKRTHFAIVVDEFGGTDGVITMEDILEEIVGEIRDEYDEEEYANFRIDEFNYMLEGKMMINEACKLMNLPVRVFDPIRGDSETVAGLILELAGEIPKVNQVLVAQDFTFTVMEVEMNRIKKIKVTITAPPTE